MLEWRGRVQGAPVCLRRMTFPRERWRHVGCRWACIAAWRWLLPAWASDGPSRPPALAEQGPKPKPVPPPAAGEIERSIGRGVAFLLGRQNQDGSWGSANITRPSEVYAPVPGAHQAFHAAVTALCISALIETGGHAPETVQALDRAEAWLLENLPKVRRATPDAFYNTWTHAYGIHALVEMLDRRPNDAERRQRIRADRAPDRHARTLRGGRRRLGLLRFQRPHAEAQRINPELRHGGRAGGLARGKAGRHRVRPSD